MGIVFRFSFCFFCLWFEHFSIQAICPWLCVRTLHRTVLSRKKYYIIHCCILFYSYFCFFFFFFCCFTSAKWIKRQHSSEYRVVYIKIITKIFSTKVRTSANTRKHEYLVFNVSVCDVRVCVCQHKVRWLTGWLLVLNSTRTRLRCCVSEFNSGCVTLIRKVTWHSTHKIIQSWKRTRIKKQQHFLQENERTTKTHENGI